MVKNPGTSGLEVGQEVDGSLKPIVSNDTTTTLSGRSGSEGNSTIAGAAGNSTGPAAQPGTVTNPISTGASGTLTPAAGAVAPAAGAPAAGAPAAVPAAGQPAAQPTPIGSAGAGPVQISAV